MACVSEAMGLALPYSAGTPAPYEQRDKFALQSGKAVMNLLAKNIRPRDIVTRKALENAATIVAAFSKAFLVTMSLGLIFLASNSITILPLAFAYLSLSSYGAGVPAE